MTTGVFINYAGVPHEMSSLFPDNGLASLAAVLKENGYDVKIFDYSTTTTIRQVYSPEIRHALAAIAPIVYGDRMLDREEIDRLLDIETEINRQENHFLNSEIKTLSAYIAENKVKWVGFKLWMGSIKQSMYIAEALKKVYPELKIFCGGPGVDIFQDALMKKYPLIDVLALAEAEHALPLLIKWCEGRQSISQIPNIIYKNGEEYIKNQICRITDLDALPFPLYDHEIYPAMADNQKMKIFCFDDSRGCPRRCAFCPGVNKFNSKRIEKSASRCISEIKFLKETYGVNYFRFSGSNTSATLLYNIAEQLVLNKIDISFAVFSSAVGLKTHMIEKLAEAGLYSIFVGIESADTGQLKKYLGKPQSLDELERIFKDLRKNNIFISTSMIYPAPFSSDAVFKENMNYLLKSLAGYENCSVAIYPAGLYPYTKWFENMEEFGFSLECGSKDEYLNEVLDYRYNIILPRYLWKDLPYKLNGKSFKELLLETNKMGVLLKQNGILPYLVEANLMMAHALDYRDYKKFAYDSNIAFFTGDYRKLEAWNAAFNRR